MIGEQMIDRI